MSKIVTIGREFGSGGRELGRRLAEELGIAYYDKEIITEISKRTSFSEQYVHQIVEQHPAPMYPITIGRSFYLADNPAISMVHSVYAEQTNIIKEMAQKSDCVIVGRCADYILSDMKPFRIFVYADMASKIKRCFDRKGEGEDFTEAEMKKHILAVDKNRAKYYEFYTGLKWGDKANYDMCINTTGRDMQSLVRSLIHFWE